MLFSFRHLEWFEIGFNATTGGLNAKSDLFQASITVLDKKVKKKVRLVKKFVT